MLSQPKQLDIDLWEIWIEYDQINSRYFGTLYVLGEVLVDQKSSEPYLKKIEHEGSELLLSLPPGRPGRCRRTEVLYAEAIENPAQYSSVCIFSAEQLIASFDEIEILI
ncbi:MAG TPA: hypothetical protein VNR87_15765 [Flavisolibacter sp.]|nr:hypothetical protein [Flavisolibacter sp.]